MEGSAYINKCIDILHQLSEPQSFMRHKIDSYVDFKNSQAPDLKIGREFRPKKPLEEWEINVAEAHEEHLRPFIIERDDDKKIITCIGIGQRLYAEHPPIACCAKLVVVCSKYTVLRYKSFFFLVENSNALKENVYISTMFDACGDNITYKKPRFAQDNILPIYLARVESNFIPRKDITEGVVIKELDEYFVVQTQNREIAFMHKANADPNSSIGNNIKGQLIQLNSFKLLVHRTDLPLLNEDLKDGDTINAYILKRDRVKGSNLFKASPFILGKIKTKKLRNWGSNIIKLTTNVTEGRLKFSIAACQAQAKVVSYEEGIGYKVILPDSSTPELCLDGVDCEFQKFNIDQLIDVFMDEDSHVSTFVPEVLKPTPRVGQEITGTICKITNTKIYISIGRNKTVTLPVHLLLKTFNNFAYTMSKLTIGTGVNCIVVDDDPNEIIVSRRYYDRYAPINFPFEGCVYAAVVVEVSYNTVVYIDVLNIYTDLCKTDLPELINGMIIYVACTSRNEYSFKFHCLQNEMLQCDDPESDSDQHVYIPGESSDEFWAEEKGETESETHDNPEMTSPYDSSSVEREGETEDSSSDEAHIETSQAEYQSSSEENERAAISESGKPKAAEKGRGSSKQTLEGMTITESLDSLDKIHLRTYTTSKNINPVSVRKFLRFLRERPILKNVGQIALKVGLPGTTVNNWHKKAHADPNWSPLIAGKAATRKVMTELLEGAIMSYIYRKFLLPGYQFNDKMCAEIALAFWEKYPSERRWPTFKASNRWVMNFKKKNNMVSRMAHFKKRPKQTVESIETSRRFMKELGRVYSKHESEGTLKYLINIDETHWKVYNFGGLTWASRGSEHIECNIEGNEKDGLTAIAAISASKEHPKLPLCIVKKGLSERAKVEFERVGNNFQIEVSREGWSDTECFAAYLIWLRTELNARYKNEPGFTDETNIDLILDMYASHRNKHIKALARALHFHLYFIPAGFTDAFQPLDRYVFGALKSMARSKYYAMHVKNPKKKFTASEACMILFECWSSISNDVFTKAWLPYSDATACDFDSLIHPMSINFTVPESALTISDDEDYVTEQSTEPNEELYEEEEEEEGEENIRDEIALFSKIDDSDSLSENMEILEIIKFENFLIGNSEEQDSLVKTILNHDGTCYVNTLIQILSVIPGLKKEMEYYSTTKNSDDSEMNGLLYCMNIYENGTKDIGPFDSDICSDIRQDITEVMEDTLQKCETEYGLTIYTNRHLTLNIQPTSEHPIEEALDSIIDGKPYLLNKLLMVRKDEHEAFEFPEIIHYGKHVLILKMLVVHKENPEHFFVDIREKFSNGFCLINDGEEPQIATIEDVLTDPCFLGIYYVFNENEEEGTAPPTEENIVPPTEENIVPPTEEGTAPPTEEGTAPPSEEGTAPPTEDALCEWSDDIPITDEISKILKLIRCDDCECSMQIADIHAGRDVNDIRPLRKVRFTMTPEERKRQKRIKEREKDRKMDRNRR